MDPPANTNITETINMIHYRADTDYTCKKQEFASYFKKYKQQSKQISGILLLLVSINQ